MAITTANDIPALLRPGLNAVGVDAKLFPDLWKPIYSMNKSNKTQEVDVQIKLLSAAELSQPGGQVAYDSFSQQYITTYYHQYFKKGFVLTHQALDDNLYKDRFPMAATALADSMREVKNIQAFNVFNNGFSAASPIGDGQPFFSTQHPIQGGTYSNTFSTPVGLNESALQDIIILIRNLRSDSGIRVNYEIKQLLVPPNLEFTASRLLNSKDDPETANRSINPINNGRYFKRGFISSVYLVSPTAWYVTLEHPDGLKFFQRNNLDIDIFPDIDTDNLKCRAFERYSFGTSNGRAAAGSQGA